MSDNEPEIDYSDATFNGGVPLIDGLNGTGRPEGPEVNDPYEPDGRVNQGTECGTVAGYLRHQHWMQKPCDGCAAAWAEFSPSKPAKYPRNKTERKTTS